MKPGITGKWNFIRLLRLGLGIIVIVQAIQAKDWGLGLLGLLFTAMPVFNFGCCSTGYCDTPVKKTTETTKDINYEEIV